MSKKHDDSEKLLARRGFVGGALGVAAAVAAGGEALAKPKKKKEGDPEQAAAAPAQRSWAASPPAGFVPFSAPGRVLKVSKANTLQPNMLWPTEDAARVMLARLMAEFTGEQDLGKAFGKFVHPSDKVAIKVNGIAAQTGATMGSNKELVLEIIKGVLASGVPAANIHVFEQYPSFLSGTRINPKVLPPGVTCSTHNTQDAVMPELRVAGVTTRFCRQLTDCTAVINVPLIKDHGITGYTGALKNMTHGCVLNPQAFHSIGGSPHIPLLYAQDVIKSRMRLQITDGYKLIYNGGPLDKDKNARIPHESLYISTDPVAMDVVGWQLLDKIRNDKGLPSFKKAKREPHYIRLAGDMGLGIADQNGIVFRELAM
jgi:uncharacterized protein (DUF362 family)